MRSPCLPLVVDPPTPSSGHSLSPKMSPAEASTMTPTISNVSNNKIKKSGILRPVARSRYTGNGGNNRHGNSPSPRHINQQLPSPTSRVRSSDSVTVVTGNHQKNTYSNHHAIKSKQSEDPPSDVCLNESHTTNAENIKARRSEEEPEGSHIMVRSNSNNNLTSEKTLSQKHHQKQQQITASIPAKTSSVSIDAQRAAPNNTRHASPSIKSSPLRDRLQRSQEPTEEREPVEQRRPQSGDPRKSPVRSSSRSLRRPSPKEGRHNNSKMKNFDDQREDVENEQIKGRDKSSSPKQRRKTPKTLEMMNRPQNDDGKVVRMKNQEIHSSYSQLTQQSLNTVGASTLPSVSIQSLESFGTHFPSVPKRRVKEAQTFFEQAVGDCGDIIYATVTAIATGAESANDGIGRTANATPGPVVAEVVPNLSDVTGITQLTEKALPNVDELLTCSPAWWIQMFQRMKQEHEAELKQWKSDLEIAKEKKSAYKAELKHSLVNQLNWLEDQTLTTDTVDRQGICRMGTSLLANKALSALPSQEGIEVTVDTALQMKRIHQLEQELQDTIEQHALERQQWYSALQEAAAVTASGEQLSLKQQEQLVIIQKQAQDAVSKQRLQWKEKTRVLTELLELTEQQHRQEIQEWNAEKEKLKNTIEVITHEKNELTVEFDRILSDMQELTEDADEAYKEASIQKDQAASALKLCNDFEEQASTALKEAADFKDQAFKAQDEKKAMKQRVDEIQALADIAQNEAKEWKITAEKALAETEDVRKHALLDAEELRRLLDASREECSLIKGFFMNEMNDLKEQLELTQNEHKEAKEQATNALKLCSDYEEQMDLTFKDASQWQQEVETVRKDIHDVKAENDAIRKENTVLTEQANKSKQEMESIKVILKTENEIVKQENLVLTEQISKQQQLMDSSAKLAEINIELSSKENSTMKEQLTTLQNDVDTATKEVERYKAEIGSIQEEVGASRKENDASKHEVECLKNELESTKEELESAKSEMEASRKECHASIDAAKASKEEAESLRKEMDAAKNEIELSKKEVEFVRKEIKDLREQAADFTEQAFSSQKQCLKLQKNLAAASPTDSGGRHRGHRGRGEFVIRRDDWEEKLDRAIAERDLYKQESNNISESLLQVTSERDMYKLESENAVEQLALLSKSMDRLLSDSTETTEIIEYVATERDSCIQEARSCQDKVLALKKELDDLRQHLKSDKMKPPLNARHLSNVEAIEAERDLYKKRWIEVAEALRKAKAQLKDHQRNPDSDSLSEAPEKEMLESQRMQDESHESELTKKYNESFAKQNELAHRLKVFEMQRSNEKGAWKLQLEATLAESRKLAEEKKSLEKRLLSVQEKYHVEVKRMKEFVVPVDGRDSDNDMAPGRWLNEDLRDVEVEVNKKYDVLMAEHRQKTSKLEDQSDVYPSFETAPSTQHRFYPNDLTWDESLSTRDELAHKHMYDQEVLEWKRMLEDANEFNRTVMDQNEELKYDLEQSRSLYEKSKGRLERALMEIDDCKDEIDFLKRNYNANSNEATVQRPTRQDIIDQLGQHQQVFTQAVEELQRDVLSIRDKLGTAIERSDDLDEQKMRGGLFQIQKSLHGLVAELGLETEAISQYQRTVKELAEDARSGSPRAEANKARFHEQQERLLEEVGQLREQLLHAMDGEKAAAGFRCNDPVASELVAELQRKESALIATKDELEKIREKLDAERTKRETTECKNAALNAQVEAYSEELLHLQASNTRLLERIEERSLTIIDPEVSYFDDTDYSRCSWTKSKDDTSPLLEEALALAEGFTHIVNGKKSSKTELSAMELLESLSDMMEKHDTSGRTKMISSGKDISPQAHGRYPNTPDYIDIIHTETGTSPQNSPRSLCGASSRLSWGRTQIPKKAVSQTNRTPLRLLVEQLYSRCEMLEAERVRLMEITLDLIESASNANEFQLDEAIEIARRKSTEEMLKLREQSKIDQERIFHKICSHCIQKSAQSTEKKKR